MDIEQKKKEFEEKFCQRDEGNGMLYVNDFAQIIWSWIEQTLQRQREERVCKNCKYWDKITKSCGQEDLFGCIELNGSPHRDGTLGCNQFEARAK